MKLNEDKNLDPLRQLFWRNWLTSILICLAAGATVGICKQSLVAGFLSYFLLSFITTALVVYRLFPQTEAESDNYLKNGM